MTAQESVSLADAFAAAEKEEGLGEPADTLTSLPDVEVDLSAVDEQASADDDDQPEGVEPDTGDELLDLLVEEDDGTEFEGEDEGDVLDVGSDEFWDEEVEVDFGDGPETVTVQELLDGSMMRRDYTQKTQVLAAERKAQEQAIAFYDSFREDPAGVLRYLMEQVGGEEALADTSAQSVDLPAMMAPDELEEEIQRRVEEALESDPTIEDARISAAMVDMEDQFSDIETDFGVELSMDNMQLIVSEAQEAGHLDLYAAYTKLRAQAQMLQEQRSKVARGGTPRGGGAAGGGGITSDASSPVSGVAEAMERARAELGFS